MVDHVKPVHVAEPDNPADFNYHVVDLLSPYAGDVGGLWCPQHTSYVDPFNARGLLDFFYKEPRRGGPENAGNYYFGCCTITAGVVNGDIAHDLPGIQNPLWTDNGQQADPDAAGQPRVAPGTPRGGTREALILQGKDHFVRKDKEFAGGTLARFYPPIMTTWPPSPSPLYSDYAEEADNFVPYYRSAGKPFFCRQRGNKLWMMTAATIVELIQLQSIPPLTPNVTVVYHRNHYGERVLVGNIYETDDAPELFTDTGYESYTFVENPPNQDFVNPVGHTGKMFDASFEHSFMGTIIDACWSNIPESAQERYPKVVGDLYGVGNDSLFFIDDETISQMYVFTDDQGQNGVFGTVWAARRLIAIEAVPYNSERTGTTDSNDGALDRSQPHFQSGLIQIAEMVYPDRYPDGTIGEGQVFTQEDLDSHYPIKPAPRDTPWMVGKTPNSKSLCCGKFIWGGDDPGSVAGGFEQQFRVDPRPGEGFAAIEEDKGPEIFPGFPALKGTVAFETHWLNLPANLPQIKPYDRASGAYATSYTMECRGYDRLPENDSRGAIDCVLWTKGMLLKNDAFHAQAPPDELPNAGTNRFKRKPKSDDYHVTVRNPIVDFRFNLGNLTGREPVMEQPLEAGIWIRRWKKGADARKAERVPPEYLPYDESLPPNHPTNLAADWVIERHDILENGYVPIACCLTPYGDFCYTMLEPWPENTDPFLPGMPRRDRYFRIIRPGHWDIKTRLAMPSVAKSSVGDVDMRIRPDTGVIQMDGDYTDSELALIKPKVIGTSPVVFTANGSLDDQVTNRHRSKYPVGMKCNEHWLSITNMPTVATGNFLSDSDRETLGDNPSNADLKPFEPIAFASEKLPYEWLAEGQQGDVANLTNTFLMEQWRTSYAKSRTIRNEWNIDLATGKIHVPWSSLLVNQRHWVNTPVEWGAQEILSDVTKQQLSTVGPKDEIGTGLFEANILPFSVDEVGTIWTKGSLVVGRVGPTDPDANSGFVARYYPDIPSTNTAEASAPDIFEHVNNNGIKPLPGYMNSVSGWDTVQFVGGFSPPPVNH